MPQRVLALLLVTVILLSCAVPVGAVGDVYEYCNEIKLIVGSKTAYVNGQPKVMKTISAPYINSGRLIVPLRFVAEELDAYVTWDRFMNGRTDLETGDGIIVEFLAGDKNIYIGDLNRRKDTHANAGWTKRLMQVAPVIKRDNHMYVPVRSLAEAINADLTYDAKTKTVTLRRVDAKGWKEYTEPDTGTKIKYPHDWIEDQGLNFNIFKNGTHFSLYYESKPSDEVLNGKKELLIYRGWKVVTQKESYLKLERESSGNRSVYILSTKKLPGGSLVYTVENQYYAAEWNLPIVNKIIFGLGFKS